MMNYQRNLWYWLVGQAEDIFSAPAFGYVSADDQGYTAFVAAGGTPTKISSNDMILLQLDMLDEKATTRMRLEAAGGSTTKFPVGTEFAGKTAKQAISAINDQKDTLRAQLS